MAKRKVSNAQIENKGLGAPSTYDPEFCNLLLEHMKHGNSFESFGSVIRRSLQTLYTWQDAHPEFLEARKLGMVYLRKFYEDLGRTIATGNLRRLIAEEPMLDAEGKLMYEANGQLTMKRTYAAAIPNAAVYIFMTKNMLGWRNEMNIIFEELPPGSTRPTSTPIEGIPTDQLKSRMRQLMLKAATDDPEMMEHIKRGLNGD